MEACSAAQRNLLHGWNERFLAIHEQNPALANAPHICESELCLPGKIDIRDRIEVHQPWDHLHIHRGRDDATLALQCHCDLGRRYRFVTASQTSLPKWRVGTRSLPRPSLPPQSLYAVLSPSYVTCWCNSTQCVGVRIEIAGRTLRLQWKAFCSVHVVIAIVV